MSFNSKPCRLEETTSCFDRCDNELYNEHKQQPMLGSTSWSSLNEDHETSFRSSALSLLEFNSPLNDDCLSLIIMFAGLGTTMHACEMNELKHLKTVQATMQWMNCENTTSNSQWWEEDGRIDIENPDRTLREVTAKVVNIALKVNRNEREPSDLRDFVDDDWLEHLEKDLNLNSFERSVGPIRGVYFVLEQCGGLKPQEIVDMTPKQAAIAVTQLPVNIKTISHLSYAGLHEVAHKKFDTYVENTPKEVFYEEMMEPIGDELKDSAEGGICGLHKFLISRKENALMMMLCQSGDLDLFVKICEKFGENGRLVSEDGRSPFSPACVSLLMTHPDWKHEEYRELILKQVERRSPLQLQRVIKHCVGQTRCCDLMRMYCQTGSRYYHERMKDYLNPNFLIGQLMDIKTVIIGDRALNCCRVGVMDEVEREAFVPLAETTADRFNFRKVSCIFESAVSQYSHSWTKLFVELKDSLQAVEAEIMAEIGMLDA